MSEELEGYRQFSKNELIEANPLYPPEQDDETDSSKILKIVPDPYGIPDEIKDDVKIFRNSVLHSYLKYNFQHYGHIKIICNITDLVLFYNDGHKRNISYDAVKFALKIIGYITYPQYYSNGCKTNRDDILFGVDSEQFQELKRYFEINNDHDAVRIKYVVNMKSP